MVCAEERFEVPWLLQHEWVSGVEFAHRVFGAMVLTQVGCWMTLFLELSTLRQIYLLSGSLMLTCGAWLGLWCLVLL